MTRLYNDTNKYSDLRVSDLSLKEIRRNVRLSFRLCMVLKKADDGFIEEIFMKEVKANTFFKSLRVIESTVEFKAFGKSFNKEVLNPKNDYVPSINTNELGRPPKYGTSI